MQNIFNKSVAETSGEHGITKHGLQLPVSSNEEINPLENVAKKYGKAKKVAWDAQAARVSRRLLLAIRSQKLTVSCPNTGIVSLLEIPAIPGFSAVYSHPLSSLENARGLAQQGIDYLRKLDTQVLAGILIVLADSYELFRFQESDSGAQKNAILRSAGKDMLIDAILIVEHQIHNRNIQFLPKLSLVCDVYGEFGKFDVRLHQYLELLTEAIRKPDLERYDENAAPKKIGRPVYIRDVEKKEKQVSYLARQEIASVKKQLASDAKAAKTLTANLVSLGFAKEKMKAFIAQLMADNGMALIEVDQSLVDMLINQKLMHMDHSDAIELIKILKKDRSILKKEVSEFDDPTPGNESAISEEQTVNPIELTVVDEDSWATEEVANALDAITEANTEPQPPEGLSTIEKILWKKKLKATQPKSIKPQLVQQDIPSVAVYVPTDFKKKLGGD